MGKGKRTRAGRAAEPRETAAPKERLDPWLWAILAAALAVRVAYWALSRQSPFYEPRLLDAGYYHQWALRVASGDLAHPAVFYGLPLYPFFLGLVYALTGASVAAVKFVQIALGVATVFFVHRTAEKLSSRAAARWAAGLAAFYGPLFFHEGIFIPEAIGVPLYAAAFYFALEFADRPTLRRGLFLGVLTGLAALTKAGVLLFAVLFVPYLWKKFGAKALKPAGAFAAAMLCTLLPVTAHNLYRGHDLVFLTSHAGFNFYVGNNPKAEGVFAAPEGTGTNVDAQIEDSKAVAEREMGRELKPSEVSEYWSDKAKAWIRENPDRFLALCGRKFLLFFDAREISDVNDYQFERELNPMMRIPWPSFFLLGPLFFAGLFAIRNSRYRSVVYLWIGAYLVGMISFFVNARYRLPLLPVFLALGGAGVQEFVAQKKTDLRIAVLLLFAAAGAGIGSLKLVSTSWSSNWVNAGDVYAEDKDYERARPFYEKGLEADPDSPKGNLAMGVTLTATGRRDEAEAYYRKSLALEPSSQAWNNLGMWQNAQGDTAAAEESFRKAIELKPNSSQPYTNLGMIYGNRGQFEQAAEMLEKSIALNPKSPRAHLNLGLCLHRLGRTREAVAEWQEALRIDPAFADARKLLQMAGASTN